MASVGKVCPCPAHDEHCMRLSKLHTWHLPAIAGLIKFTGKLSRRVMSYDNYHMFGTSGIFRAWDIRADGKEELPQCVCRR